MTSLSGILSLHDAFNTETWPSLNPNQLTLGDVKDKDLTRYFQSYTQPILYGDIKLVLQTPAVPILGLVYHHYSAGAAVRMTVSPWLRQQFNMIDAFVKDAVTIPTPLLKKWGKHPYSYKPICQDKDLFMIMSPTCRLTQDTEDGVVELSMNSYPVLSEGWMSLTLDFEHVYIGWHRSSCLYSVNYRVTHIHFKPKN